MLENNPRLKKILTLIGVGAVLLIVILIVYPLLTTGKLTVTTGVATDYVSITPVTKGVRDLAKGQESQHKLSARLKPGSYEISAFNKSLSTTKIVSVKARKSFSISLDLDQSKVFTLEPVYGSSGSSLVADGTQLRFLDTNNILTTVDSQNNLSTILPTTKLYGAKWANTGLGIVRDSNNILYVINNNSLSPLTLPFSTTKQTVLSYDISAAGTIYVSNNETIYAGTASGNFKKLYAGKKPIVSLAASPGKVAAIVDEGDDEDNAGPIVVVADSGKSITTDIDSNALAWSQGGNYLVAQGEAGGVVLDAKLNKITNLPSQDTDVFAWGSADTLYYSRNGVLWSYTTSSGRSQQVAEMPSQNLIDGVYPSRDGSYVYVSAQKTALFSGNPTLSQLFRVGLKNQKIDNSLSVFSVIMPETIGDCSLNYINFSRPTIMVGSPSPDQAASCQLQASSELQNYHINVNNLQFTSVALQQTDD